LCAGMATNKNNDKVQELFKQHDKNGDGKITRQEFTSLFKAIDASNWDTRKIDILFNTADNDKSGSISVEEFLAWVFKKPQGRSLMKAHTIKAKPEAEVLPTVATLKTSQSNFMKAKTEKGALVDDTDTSSWDSSDDDDEELEASKVTVITAAPVRTRTKKVHRAKDVINEQTFYEMLSFTGGEIGGGQVGARLHLGDLCDMFAKCKRAGFGPDLPRLVPQDVKQDSENLRDSEDLSPFEVVHLFAMLHDDMPLQKGTDQERLEAALKVIEENRDACREMEWSRRDDVEKLGLDPEASVGWGLFQDLTGVIQGLMLVDKDHLLSNLLWSFCDSFELTNAIATRVMEAVFLKTLKKGGDPVLQLQIKSNDFMRMCHVQQLADNSGAQGIPHAQLSLFFASTLMALPRLLAERDRLRGFKKDPKEQEHHTHKSICGRIKLSILFGELFKAMPAGLYQSPLQMVMSLLENADAINAVAKK